MPANQDQAPSLSTSDQDQSVSDVTSSPNYFRWMIYSLLVIFVGGTYTLVIYRAWAIPMWIDEAFTFHYYIAEGWKRAATMRIQTPNNHWLNTFLAAICYDIFGPREFYLRLPNILAFGPFVVFFFLAARRLFPRATAAIATLFLLSDANVIQYFSCCRGYGLALMFYSFSLYFLIEFLYDPTSVAKSGLANAGAMGACLANMTFLMYYIILVPSIMLIGWIADWRTTNKTWRNTYKYLGSKFFLVQFLLGTTAFGLIAPMFVELKLFGGFYFGGHGGFVDTTFGSIVQYWTTIATPWDDQTGLVAQVVAGLLMVIALVQIILVWRGKRPAAHLTPVILLAAMIAFSLVQHVVLKTPFLIERTALIFVPLLVLVLANLLALVEFPLLGRIAFILLAGVFAYNVYQSEMMLVIPVAQFDNDNFEILDDIASLAKDREAVKLSVPWPVSRSMRFYLGYSPNYVDKNIKFHRVNEKAEGDFLVYYPSRNEKINRLDFKKIKSYPRSSVELYCRPDFPLPANWPTAKDLQE